MNTTELDELPVFPQARTCPMGIAPGYHQLRETEPIAKAKMPSGEWVWLVTKYEYARALLADPRVSSDRTQDGFPVLLAFPNREAMRQVSSKSLNSMDPPDHTTHRRVLISEFTVKQIRAMRPRIQEVVNDCIEDMLSSERPVDLVDKLALRVPSQLVSELRGVPYSDREYFQQRTKIVLSRTAEPMEKRSTMMELAKFFEDLVIRKEEEASGDLLGRLVTRYRSLGQYDRNRLVGLAALLLTGGHETTSNMISLGAVALLEHPDQLAQLKRDPSLLPAAVEELLRYFSVSAELTGYRSAIDDIEIGGVTIRKGEGIVVLGSAANRDPDVFTDPDKLDIERGARHHIAFGYGMHQCLGQNLARAELEVTLGTLFARIPNLRLAVPLDDVPFKDDASIYGVHELLVTW